jgi:hypothetical protein
MVTLENYEEYLVLQADGELDADGVRALEAFLQLHPELREEQAIYENLRLAPDMMQVFGNKESLLRKEPAGKVIAIGNWWRYGAAAGIAALVTLGIMKWSSDDTQPNVAVTDTVQTTPAPQIAAIDSTPAMQQPVAVQEDAPEEKPQVTPQKAQNVQVAEVKNKEQRNIRRVEAAEPIQVASLEKLPTTTGMKPAGTSVAIPELPQIEEPAPEPYQNALAWIPVSEERKQGLNEIKEALGERFEKVKEVRDNIKNTDLAVKLGKKELFTIRF